MKRLLYLISVVVFAAGLASCNKDNDDNPTPDPVVGSWSLDRVRYAGFVAPYANYNNEEDATQANYPIRDDLTIKADKTFEGTQRLYGQVFDYDGTWELTSDKLTLKYNNGDDETLTLDTGKTPHRLSGEAFAGSDSLTNPTTQKPELVNFTVQFVYMKKN